MYGLKIKDKTIVDQMAAIRRKYTGFITKTGKDWLSIKGELQPTARSDIYTIEIVYHFRKHPVVTVLNPILIKNFKDSDIAHVYPRDKPCLYQPKYSEFKYSDYISDTIVPWLSLWLYHYEVWHITGDWLGGGEHP